MERGVFPAKAPLSFGPRDAKVPANKQGNAMRCKETLAVAALVALPFTAWAQAPVFTNTDQTGPETAVRHLTGQDLTQTLQKGMTPGAFYSQILLSRHDGYQIINTIRDKDGQAETHQDWNDNIFVQEGRASFVTGGTAKESKLTAPGEHRGTAIAGGVTAPMRPGDYFFVPAGTPHQMLVAPGQRIKFIAFKTHI
jgi:mannose-6-phosphate isomerase-like protein (cupin superfamily)